MSQDGNDEHHAARENPLRVDDPRCGELVPPAPMPRMSATPPRFDHAGGELGHDDRAVHEDLLGLSKPRIEAPSAAGMI